MALQPSRNGRNSPVPVTYGSNESTALNVFYHRQAYYDEVFGDDFILNQADTWDVHRYYGVMNTNGNAVYPDQSQLKPLRYSEGRPLMALNFVADAWRDLSERCRELARQNIMFKNSPWANPVAVKAWESSDQLYSEYMGDIVYVNFREFLDDLPQRGKSILNIEDFLNEFSYYVRDVLVDSGPVTRSGFLESYFCSLRVSGLIIEVSDARYDQDSVKSMEFLDDNFQLFAQIANQYGFSIDQNIPWRLVADLNNPAMIEYMTGVPIEDYQVIPQSAVDCDPITLYPDEVDPWGFSQLPGLEGIIRHVNVYLHDGSLRPGYQNYQTLRTAVTGEEVAEKVYSQGYYETWETDMEVLWVFLLAMYNGYVNDEPLVRIPPGFPNPTTDPCRFSNVYERTPEVEALFSRENGAYRNRWFLKTFYLLRTIERKRRLDTAQHEAWLQDILTVFDMNVGTMDERYFRALSYAQDKYVGSIDDTSLTFGIIGSIMPQESDDLRERRTDAISNIGRQGRVRRDLYER
jgi:hypothetical protein